MPARAPRCSARAPRRPGCQQRAPARSHRVIAHSRTARTARAARAVVPIKAWATAARPAKQGDLADETALLDAISIVELRAVNAQGTIATGTFAFSGGE